MRTNTLQGTDVTTSALGFGCAGLTSLNDRARAVRLLNAAFDAGVTHFDVARLYGFGHAEAIVGEFIGGRRDRVTLTTKFGLEPPTGLVTGSAGVATLARSILRRFPVAARVIRARAGRMVSTGAFAPAAAARSLEKSLAELRTDYVDFLLLHEGTLDDARRDDLLRFLSDQLARGTVRYIGVGSSAERIGDDVSRFPPAYRLFQFENSIEAPRLPLIRNVERVAVITHSALKPLGAIAAASARHPLLTRTWSDRLGVDLASRAVVARLLLGWAFAQNSSGVTLFSTTRPENLRENVTVIDSGPDAAMLHLFAEFVASVLVGAAPAL